jgi:5-methylcytosine-specific restriction protein A
MRRCLQPQCRTRIPVDGPSRCAVHLRQREQQRGSARERGYTHRWDVYARGFLRQHPRCGDRPPEAPVTKHSRCAAEGRPVPAQHVDHITPHRGDPVLFWSRANHQALCATCHGRKTATEDTPRPV